MTSLELDGIPIAEDPRELIPVPDDNYEHPSYKDPGALLVEIYHVYPEGLRPGYHTLYELEVHEHSGGCCSLIQEGEGFDYWINGHLDVELPGFYVIQGITGTYFRGEWGFSDDDVDYDGEWIVRRAAPEEIAALCIIDENNGE